LPAEYPPDLKILWLLNFLRRGSIEPGRLNLEGLDSTMFMVTGSIIPSSSKANYSPVTFTAGGLLMPGFPQLIQTHPMDLPKIYGASSEGSIDSDLIRITPTNSGITV
jgi:hypothetical protein